MEMTYNYHKRVLKKIFTNFRAWPGVSLPLRTTIEAILGSGEASLWKLFTHGMVKGPAKVLVIKKAPMTQDLSS